MEIKSETIQIKIASNFLEPTLELKLTIVVPADQEVPVSISGLMKSEDQIKLCPIIWNGWLNRNLQMGLGTNRPVNTNKIDYYPHFLEFYSILNKNAIDHIEDCRLKNQGKDAILNMELEIKYLAKGNINSGSIFKVYNYERSHKIEQSLWVKEFAPNLGIGDFLILELKLPQYIHNKYQKLASELIDAAKELKDEITEGNFKQVLKDTFQVFELILPSKNSEAESLFEELFEVEKWDEDYKTKWLNMLNNIHSLYSKPKHKTNKEKKYNPNLEFKKEDAYYAYAICIGVINLLFKKMERL